MTTFSAVLVFAATREDALGFVPADLREKVTQETSEGYGYRYALRNAMPGVWELTIELASDLPLTEEAVWDLDSAHGLTGTASFKPVGATDTELQERIDQLPLQLHWSTALSTPN